MENKWSRLIVDSRGRLSLLYGNKPLIDREPLVRLAQGGRLYVSGSARMCGTKSAMEVALSFATGVATIRIENKNEYFRITATSVPEKTASLVFGPYLVKKPLCGELLGVVRDDKTAVCIQSLNPKTVGGFIAGLQNKHPYKAIALTTPYDRVGFCDCAALPVKGGGVLQCYAEDMKGPRRVDFGGMKNVEACPVEGEDSVIEGAAVALLAVPENRLLDTIEKIELREGLPHPTIDGEWAKKSPCATESYFMMNQNTKAGTEKAFRWLKRSDLRCFYTWFPFASWGHFEIDPKFYAGGDKGLRKAAREARKRGYGMGFHTLSNFIHTRDAYVSPVPHENLLVMDRTVITRDVGKRDRIIEIRNRNNFGTRSHLNVIRIGDELIRFDTLSEAGGRFRLLRCERGAFNTVACAHEKGAQVARLWDHGYKTMFPDLKLQEQMATRIGSLIKYTGIRRMSFDGMEGCLYTGRGEYACSEYVRRVYSICGDELLSDASTPSHYRWHAHSYFNWGEPYYDFQGRGGMFLYRTNNQDFFTRNYMPHMLGQYQLRLCRGRFEATSLENFEFMLSQTIAHNAGFGFDCSEEVLSRHGLTDRFLDAIRVWNDMRFNAGEIPASVREAMKDENANWHLDECRGGWLLHKLRLQQFDFGYRSDTARDGKVELLCIDMPTPTPHLLKIRVGTSEEKGTLNYLAFYPGWGGFDPLLAFRVKAKAGDYLVYEGGCVLKRFDCNYNFIGATKGVGKPVNLSGTLAGIDVHYKLSSGSGIRPFVTVYQNKETLFIRRRA